MLLDVVRLRDSGLASDETPEACWAAVLLWAAAWHQVPAASIPSSDSWIAKQAGYAQRGKIDVKAWARVRDGALRNFVECSDGRLYHPVVAEKALECWLEKLGSQLSSGAGNAKRWKIAFDPAPIETQMAIARELLKALNPQSRALTKRRKPGAVPQSPEDPAGSPDGTPKQIPPGSQEKDKGREEGSSEPNGSGSAGAPPPVDKSTEQPAAGPTKREALNTCGAWLMANGLTNEVARDVMGKVLKDFPAVAVAALAKAPTQAVTADPAAYLMAVAKGLADDAEKPRRGAAHPTPTAEETAEALRRQAEERQRPTDPETQAAIEAAAARAKQVRDRIAGATA